MVAQAIEPIVGPNESNGEDDGKTTLEKQGATLPIGVEVGGSFHRSIEIRPWKLKQERAIGKLRDKNKKATPFQFASLVLATMCKRLGPHDFSDEKLKMSKKRLAITQMFLGDVMYSYLWLRRQSLGPILPMKLTCPNCMHDYGFKADMDTIPVTAVDNIEESLWDYKLEHPFEVRGKTVEVLTFGPSRWGAFEPLMGQGGVKAATIVGSLYKLDGVAHPIAEQELDEMDKLDFETVVTMLDDHHVGPDMSLDMKCPSCNHNYKTVINWSEGDFFGVSGTK